MRKSNNPQEPVSLNVYRNIMKKNKAWTIGIAKAEPITWKPNNHFSCCLVRYLIIALGRFRNYKVYYSNYQTPTRTTMYLRFTIWSSWFPLLRWTSLGYTSWKANRISRISMESFPRSTKSPLKTYGVSNDGKPFWRKIRVKITAATIHYKTPRRRCDNQHGLWHTNFIEHQQEIFELSVQVSCRNKNRVGEEGRPQL